MTQQAPPTGPVMLPGTAVLDWTAPSCAAPPPDGLMRLRQVAARLADHPQALELLAHINAAARELEAHRRNDDRLAVMTEVAQLLSAAGDVDVTLTGMARAAVPRLADACVIYLLDERAGVRWVACQHEDPSLQGLLEELAAVSAPRSGWGGASALALQNGDAVFQPVVAPDLFERALPPQQVARLAPVLPRSAVAVPLKARGGVLGVISFAMGTSGRSYEVEDLELVRELADRAAMAVENAELFRKLEEAHALQDTLFRSTPVGLALLDRELRFLRANDAMAGLLGARACELPGRAAREVAPRLGRYMDAAGRRLMAGIDPVLSVELDASRPRSGRPWHWLVTLYPVRTPAGKCLGLGAAVVDITARKEAELAAQAARHAAESANLAKSQFLAVMSHELRTPLTTVIGYADLLMGGTSGPVSPRQQDQLRRIKTSAWHLVGIIEEILTFSRAEAGKEPVALELTDVAALAREAAETIGPQALGRGLSFRAQGIDGMERVLTDGGKIRQILLNLLGNAVKFTERGGVALELAETDGSLVFSVRDTGPGIAPADQEAIFEPFRQLDQSSTRQQGGTGLGLTVSRQLARLLGGDVCVCSEPGAGSVFTLRIPAARHQSISSRRISAVPSGR